MSQSHPEGQPVSVANFAYFMFKLKYKMTYIFSKKLYKTFQINSWAHFQEPLGMFNIPYKTPTCKHEFFKL